MVTIFAIPKPFCGHIKTTQENALRSWRRLSPDCEIILYGDEAGTERAAAKCNARYVPSVKRNEFGTPLLDDVFRTTAATATHSRVCYVNADIILMSDFLAGLARIPLTQFLMIGQRWDVDITERLDFSARDWETQLRQRVQATGTLHAPEAMDYFAFPLRCGLEKLLPFAVGRGGWDQWFIYHAHHLKIPVIDASSSVMAVHQNHDYRHVPGNRGAKYEGPETDQHKTMLAGIHIAFNTHHATHILTEAGIDRARAEPYLSERPNRMPAFHPRLARCLPSWKLRYAACRLFPALAEPW